MTGRKVCLWRANESIYNCWFPLTLLTISSNYWKLVGLQNGSFENKSFSTAYIRSTKSSNQVCGFLAFLLYHFIVLHVGIFRDNSEIIKILLVSLKMSCLHTYVYLQLLLKFPCKTCRHKRTNWISYLLFCRIKLPSIARNSVRRCKCEEIWLKWRFSNCFCCFRVPVERLL